VKGDEPYLVAEFVDGVTLPTGARQRAGVSYRVFARLVQDALAGLDRLHRHSLVRGQPGTDGCCCARTALS